MRRISIALLITAIISTETIAADANLFELHLVATAPNQTAKPYALPHRDGRSETILVEPEVLLDQSAIQFANLSSESDGSPQILLWLSKDGAKRFGEITGQNINKRLAMFLDHQLRLAPVVRARIDGDRLAISGIFTQAEADALIAKLNEVASARPLPDELKPVQDFTRYQTADQLWQLLEQQLEFEKHLHPGEAWTSKEQDAARERRCTIAGELLRRFPDDPHRWEAKKIKSQTRDTEARAREGKELIDELATAPDVPQEIRKWARNERLLHYVIGQGQSGEAEINSYCHDYPEDVVGCAELKIDAAQWYLHSSDATNRQKGELLLRDLIANGPGSTVSEAEKLLADKEKIREADEERRKQSGARWAAARDKKVAELGQFVGNPFDLKFIATDGSPVDATKLHGKVVLIDFWGTWCGVCIQQMPELAATYRKYHDRGFEIVGIATDKNADLVRKFVKEKDIPWPQCWDEGGKITHSYKIEMFPTAFLVNKKGVIAENASFWAYPESAEPGKKWNLEIEIEKLLAE